MKALSPLREKQAEALVNALMLVVSDSPLIDSRGTHALRGTIHALVVDFAVKVAGKKPPEARASSGTIQRLEAHYCALYQRYVGEEALLAIPKDRLILRMLEKRYGEHVVQQRLDAFFELGKTDHYVKRTGYSLGVLRSVWHTLATKGQQLARQLAGCHHQPTCSSASEHTRRELEGLKAPRSHLHIT